MIATHEYAWATTHYAGQRDFVCGAAVVCGLILMFEAIRGRYYCRHCHHTFKFDWTEMAPYRMCGCQTEWPPDADLRWPQRPLSASEHSRLVYLLDALQVAPHKSDALFAIALHPNDSGLFRKTVEGLRESDDIVRAAIELRERLR